MHEPYCLKQQPRTDPLPQPSPQPQATRTFTSIAELHNAGFLDKVSQWFDTAIEWMLAIHRGDAHPPPRPDCFVASNSEAFVHEAQGKVWDARRQAEGIITPLDFTAIQESKWNVEWLREQWGSYWDQEAVSHACDGADHKLGDMELQYCFTPHLLSMGEQSPSGIGGYQTCYDC